ncbi:MULTISPECIES: protease pro-enzyme activation domain-containing protein [Paraburkholderia]|uniref:S53 family peptidase n=1 Tax=Paraburkholderia TaxID=1822464 RepID=UPI002252A057|nr:MULTISPECIES: S53 family peptidase [Paraburkholderia]MCX4161239.1 S53 family peptidase [Paraburkholderia megapolitana]MDN7156735.1 S53 family peptidase [Paraburkholderia sp. CHISQ3]MDQ6493780.1 S53 family peptidase [Paraburkholderia megapolitana]
MKKAVRINSAFSGNFAKALLPLAIAATLVPMSAHAADSWVATRTGAFLLPAAHPAGAVAQSEARTTSAATGYALGDAANELTNTLVTPLEISQPLHVTVVLKGRNDSQLDTFLREVNQPGSPNYRQYLTPEQFKARFAPTDAQVQAVVEHLKASGFTNISVSENNKLISADGNANNAQSGFHTNLKRFNYRGKQVFANDSAALVPSSLSSSVESVLGLQNAGVPHRLIRRFVPANAALASANAEVNTEAKAAAGSQVAHQPTDFAKIYDAAGLPAATNTTVGIITWGDLTQTIADLKTFTTSAKLATVNTKVVAGGKGTLADDGDPSEWDLDSQDIIGTSGGVKQLIFYSAINGDSQDSGLTDATLTDAYNKAVTDNLAKVINVSLGLDEASANSDGSLAADDAVFKQAVAQGQIFSVSSGDAGVYQWSTSPQGAPGYIGTSSDGSTVKTTINLSKYSVSSPASSPYVVAVGGTTLSTTNKTTWAGETVWNEGWAFADTDQFGDPVDDSVRIWATGGGVSQYETAPTWQTTALGKTVTKRVVPDVAFDAASGTGALIVINGQAGQQVGGTSLASPIFVGGWARVESAHQNSLGLPTSGFYQTFLTDTSNIHDVTSGNNGYGGKGYTAKAGWDDDTGFGSLDFTKLSATYK